MFLNLVFWHCRNIAEYCTILIFKNDLLKISLSILCGNLEVKDRSAFLLIHRYQTRVNSMHSPSSGSAIETSRAAIAVGSLSTSTYELETFCLQPLSRSVTPTCTSHNAGGRDFTHSCVQGFYPS